MLVKKQLAIKREEEKEQDTNNAANNIVKSITSRFKK